MEPEGSYIALVVSLRQAADSTWQLVIDRPDGLRTAALAPAQFVLRIWRGENGTMRGNVRRAGDESVAPFQCNNQLQQMIDGWLAFE